MSLQTDFQPNWVCPPGATIQDILQERQLTRAYLGQKLQLEEVDVADLLEGRTAITLRLASQLARLLGASAEFWMARDAQYRADVARLNGDGRTWLKALPISDMVKFGWFSQTPKPAEELSECLAFFGVGSIGEWERRYKPVLAAAAFRTSPTFDSNPLSVAAWLRRGEIEAESIVTAPWNAGAFRACLSKVRELTRIEDPSEFLPKLTEICASAGVAVVIARAPSGCRASGATMFLSSEKAMLLLSFRYLSDDHFWFTFFHEAAHLVLHDRNQVFLEGVDPVSQAQEDEANRFAEEVLIPQHAMPELLALKRDIAPIARFAKKIGVSAGIVVGQLQHFGKVPRGHFNTLKVRYDWED